MKKAKHMKRKSLYTLGIDIGSTTVKMVLLDVENGRIVLDSYRRHKARVLPCLKSFLSELDGVVPEAATMDVCLTGSVGIGVAERLKLPFIQEVVAASHYMGKYFPNAGTMIDIGGEDAKMVFFTENGADLRMNGNCAGGTGAFIDQMAALLHMSASEFGDSARNSTRIYPIASRCGVFCKTDVQNLIARNVPEEDIAASVFHAVAVQTFTTLAHGHRPQIPILLCGGPLTFIPALRKAFSDYLDIPSGQFILPEKANLIPAWGAAVSGHGQAVTLSELGRRLDTCRNDAGQCRSGEELSPIFGGVDEYESWKRRMSGSSVEKAEWHSGTIPVYIGIDSGSTTTKIMVLDGTGKSLFSYYGENGGNPVRTVKEGLEELKKTGMEHGADIMVVGSCSTGYGEDLIKAAYHLDSGIVETLAHYLAARNIAGDVSFILDIGGQDMKASFVENGTVSRIEVNEACSSGCGSFISTFASSLGYGVQDFAQAACLASAPCDLGTRCTVFMNSKVKQALCEGTSAENIAAGLSYSVVKNCLYKVLRLKDTSLLGENIVVQGGTMRNDSVVRVLEKLVGKRVFRSDSPELMGAYGCALHAMTACGNHVPLDDILDGAGYTSDTLNCRGCVNRCAVTRYRFQNSRIYYSGNRCERVFNNSGEKTVSGLNAYEDKRRLLFDRKKELPHPLMTVGIPKCLNMYEEYPFWHTLLTMCNIQVKLSDVSDYGRYERCAGFVMSDNICFPAKVVHSHIDDLERRHVDRIFMPFVLYESPDSQMQNSYNCPVVTGYSQVIKSVQSGSVPVDSPVVSFRNQASLRRQCRDYLVGLGVVGNVVDKAVTAALTELESYRRAMSDRNREILADARHKGCLAVLLSGRPYHADSLVQHKVSEMIAAQGVNVLTDDLVYGMDVRIPDVKFVSQWAFPDRIMKAAAYVASEDRNLQFMQLTSFGCGPDAFLTDEVRSLLKDSGKNLTLLKLDDVDNIGSLKLRVRSLTACLKMNGQDTAACTVKVHPGSLPPYSARDRKKKIIVPFFTPFISPLIPHIMKLAGYDVDNLPPSDSSACAWGLKFSNNEVCYPATLIVGDIVKAFRSGAYDPSSTCVAMTQTGGQCRASNYISLIRKALIENGYSETPVISVTFGGGIENEQPGFKVNWLKMLPVALASILYSDCIARFYHASVVREKNRGEAARLRDRYLEAAAEPISRNCPSELYRLAERAAEEFDAVCESVDRPKVGIVGEIFLKFHPFAQKHVTEWLMSQGMEIVYPSLADFFLQGFVNTADIKKTHVGYGAVPDFLIDFLYRTVKKEVDKINAAGSRFRYFIPLDDIMEKAALAEKAITLSAQFGEGWLIAGETGELAALGVTHIISLQPFGCIANHIAGKGIENRLKALYPQINMLSLDFDSSVSEVNIINRLLLFIDNLQHTK